jgi:hypothetical protein
MQKWYGIFFSISLDVFSFLYDTAAAGAWEAVMQAPRPGSQPAMPCCSAAVRTLLPI